MSGASDRAAPTTLARQPVARVAARGSRFAVLLGRFPPRPVPGTRQTGLAFADSRFASALVLDKLAMLKIWEAEPGEFPITAAERPNAFEIMVLQLGSMTFYPDDEDPVTVHAPGVYVCEPGFNGRVRRS